MENGWQAQMPGGRSQTPANAKTAYLQALQNFNVANGNTIFSIQRMAVEQETYWLSSQTQVMLWDCTGAKLLLEQWKGPRWKWPIINVAKWLTPWTLSIKESIFVGQRETQKVLKTNCRKISLFTASANILGYLIAIISHVQRNNISSNLAVNRDEMEERRTTLFILQMACYFYL